MRLGHFPSRTWGEVGRLAEVRDWEQVSSGRVLDSPASEKALEAGSPDDGTSWSREGIRKHVECRSPWPEEVSGVGTADPQSFKEVHGLRLHL